MSYVVSPSVPYTNYLQNHENLPNIGRIKHFFVLVSEIKRNQL